MTTKQDYTNKRSSYIKQLERKCDKAQPAAAPVQVEKNCMGKLMRLAAEHMGTQDIKIARDEWEQYAHKLQQERDQARAQVADLLTLVKTADSTVPGARTIVVNADAWQAIRAAIARADSAS